MLTFIQENPVFLSTFSNLQDSHMLSLGISSHSSWWKNNGPGCNSQNPPSDTWRNHQNPKLTTVLSCWLDYQYIEVLHCTAQLFVSVSVLFYALNFSLKVCVWYFIENELLNIHSLHYAMIDDAHQQEIILV